MMTFRRIFYFLGVIILLTILIAAFTLDTQLSLAQQDTGKIEAQLQEQISSQGNADFIVRFAEQADLSAAYSMDWASRGDFVYNTLRQVAEASQANARAILDAQGIKHQTFIAGNELYVWAGNQVNAIELAALPEVASIRATRTYSIDPVDTPARLRNISWAGDLLAQKALVTVSDTAQAIIDWGITDTKANQFWSTFGVQGDGIVVANIDTGVQWNHPALDQAYKCPANPSSLACWYDPTLTCGSGGPCDDKGHGTHTMGTMVADDDPSLTYIAGMAPGARWIACKGCKGITCEDAKILACADWILAPAGNPANRPNIVNNSWGAVPGGDIWFLAKVEAWRAAGIFPAFSAGNEGEKGCNTLASPGDYQESFASAAHDSTRNIAQFSSRGSSDFGYDPYTKPNLSAPGVSICSSVPNSWSCDYSGTSMASPHTAGAVALLWSCNPALKGHVDATFQLLQDHTDPAPGGDCGAPAGQAGNFTYGYGYLDVLAAGEAGCATTQDVWKQMPLPPGCPDWTRYDGEYFAGTGKVYFMGGRDGSVGATTYGDIYAYNPATNNCVDTLADMPVPVSNYAIAKVNDGLSDYLCVLGGRTGSGAPSTAVQCYDPLENSVEILSTLPGSIGQFVPGGVAVVNNLAYVFGGFSESGTTPHTAETWVWNPIDKSWLKKGDLSLARGYIDSAVVNGKIYAFGGDVLTNSTLVAQNRAEVFNPATGTWEDDSIADLPAPTAEGVAYGFDDGSSYELAGRVILAGGGQWPNESEDVLQYIVASNSYDYSYPKLNVSRANQAGFFIPGDPGAMWVFGGRSQEPGYGDYKPPYAPPESSTVRLTRPDITVTPSRLNAYLFPGNTQTINITIANKGTSLLDWTLEESPSTRLLVNSSPFVPVEISGDQVNDQITTRSPDREKVGAVTDSAVLGLVLWDQPLSRVWQVAYVDQYFTDLITYTSFLADDFIVGSTWNIGSIFIPGSGWNGFSSLTSAISLTWQIYADLGGTPAGDPAGWVSPPVWSLTLPPDDPQVVLSAGTPDGFISNVRLNLSIPVELDPGHYWLVFYPSLAYSAGQYGRQPADTTNGYIAKFINPGGSFGYGTNWRDWTVLDNRLQQLDIAFRLEGQADTLWLSENPIQGALPQGKSQQLAVTFNSTGMTPGIYTAGLLIRTNDPEQPVFLLPVRLTVTNGELFFPMAYKH
jgi:subtilisin family serine protease